MQIDVTCAPRCRVGKQGSVPSGLALTCLKAWVYFVDDVNTTFTTHQTVRPVTAFEGLERVFNLHLINPSNLGYAFGRAHKKRRAASDTLKICGWFKTNRADVKSDMQQLLAKGA